MRYTPEEDAALRAYAIGHEDRWKGNSFWIEAEQQAVTEHTWQSMKDRWLKRLVPQLEGTQQPQPETSKRRRTHLSSLPPVKQPVRPDQTAATVRNFAAANGLDVDTAIHALIVASGAWHKAAEYLSLSRTQQSEVLAASWTTAEAESQLRAAARSPDPGLALQQLQDARTRHRLVATAAEHSHFLGLDELEPDRV